MDKALTLLCLDCDGIMFVASSTRAVMDGRDEIEEIESEGCHTEYNSTGEIRLMKWCDCKDPISPQE